VSSRKYASGYQKCQKKHRIDDIWLERNRKFLLLLIRHLIIFTRPLGPEFIVSHRTSGFAGTSLKVFAAKLLTIISPFCWTERCTYHNQLQYLAGKLLLFLLAIFFLLSSEGQCLCIFIKLHQVESKYKSHYKMDHWSNIFAVINMPYHQVCYLGPV